jgi:hypothetical protein
MFGMTVRGFFSFVLRRGAMFVAAIAAQLLLFRYYWNSLPAQQRQRIKPWFWGLFVLVNTPFLLILIDWAARLHLPAALYRALVFPLTVWQLSGVLAALVLLGGMAVSAVVLRSRAKVRGRKKRAVTAKTSQAALPAEAQKRTESLDRGRRRVLLTAAAAGMGGVALFSRGLGRGAGDPRIVRPQVEIEALPAALKGFKIAQITDIHAGYFYDVPRLQRLARIVVSLAPDLIVLTGDQMHGFHPAFVPEMVRGLKGLRAPAGVVAVLGNHDRRSGRKRVAAAMESVGWTVLQDENMTIKWRTAKLNVAGLKDWADHPDIDQALAGRVGGAPTILLSHRPRVFPQAVERDVDLVLAGHTHGGQVSLCGLNVMQSVYRYLHGMFKQRQTTMYVCAGVGVTGPPIRLGVAPELAVVELKARKGPLQMT